MGFWSSLGSSAFDSLTSGLSANLGAIDYMINPLARSGVDDYYTSMSDLSLQNQMNQALHMPRVVKQGMIDAGINPMLAVSSGFSGPAATNVPSPQSPPRLDTMQKAALIDQTNAQTDLIRKRTEGEGWQLKTLTASQARGLGMHIVKALGFNFNGSESQTFLVAYNPITGELRNVFSTDDSDATGETHDAATVRTEVEGMPAATFHYRGDDEKPYKVEYDHTKGHNLPR